MRKIVCNNIATFFEMYFKRIKNIVLAKIGYM